MSRILVGAIGAAFCVSLGMASKSMKDQWTLLPRLSRHIVIILPFVGYALLVAGLLGGNQGCGRTGRS
jgi:hypothetical protein